MAKEISAQGNFALPNIKPCQKTAVTCNNEVKKEPDKIVETHTPKRSRKIRTDLQSSVPNKAWTNNGDDTCEIFIETKEQVSYKEIDISNGTYSENSEERSALIIKGCLPTKSTTSSFLPRSPRVRPNSPCKYLCLQTENGGENGKVQRSPYFITLVTPTPCSRQDNAISINVRKNIKKKKKSEKFIDKFVCPPYVILMASILEISVYLWATPHVDNLLVYSPHQREQVWRFLTYMLLHSGVTHLTLNIIIQTLLATPLELEQGSMRCLLVYILGGLAGALGASVLQPTLYMVGASAGVYALLTSHLANVMLCYSQLPYKVFRIFSVVVLAGSDVAFSIAHWWSPPVAAPRIGWAAHCAGAVAGVMLGLWIYTGCERNHPYVKAARWFSLVMLIVGVATSVLCNIFVVKVN